MVSADNSKQVTPSKRRASEVAVFSKRRASLFKKANELAILCHAEVAVIIFSNTGKVFSFASSSMERILSRFNKCLESTRVPAAENKPEEPKEVDALNGDLNEEIEKLKLNQLQLLGKDLMGMGLQELWALEQQLNEGLFCINDRKEQILMQQLAHSRMQEQRAVLEKDTLHRQVEELQSFVSSTSHRAPLSINYHSETTSNGGLADKPSDTTLYLGPPSGVCPKWRTSDGKIHSNNSKTQLGRW